MASDVLIYFSHTGKLFVWSPLYFEKVSLLQGTKNIFYHSIGCLFLK